MTTKVTHGVTSFNTGQVIQSVYSSVATQSTQTGTIPTDGTIPQISEGTEMITVSITPKYATSKIRLRFSTFYGMASAGQSLVTALFRDAVTNALAARMENSENSANWTGQVYLEYQDSPATTSAITYRIRLGNASGNWWLNTDGAGTALFGGTAFTTLIAEEVAV